MSKHYEVKVERGSVGARHIVAQKDLDSFVMEIEGLTVSIRKIKIPPVELKRGQIWRPGDKRYELEEFYFRITDIGEDKVTVSRLTPCYGQSMLRKIRKDRFHPGVRGYVLVKDVEAEPLQSTGT